MVVTNGTSYLRHTGAGAGSLRAALGWEKKCHVKTCVE